MKCLFLLASTAVPSARINDAAMPSQWSCVSRYFFWCSCVCFNNMSTSIFLSGGKHPITERLPVRDETIGRVMFGSVSCYSASGRESILVLEVSSSLDLHEHFGFAGRRLPFRRGGMPRGKYLDSVLHN